MERRVVGPQKRTWSISKARLLAGKARSSCDEWCPEGRSHEVAHHQATKSLAAGPGGIRVKSKGSSAGNNGPRPLTSDGVVMARIYKTTRASSP